jgi:glycogen debranching enzyme
MTDPVHVGPARVIVSHADRIVVSDPAGRIQPDEEQGFLVADTRLVSRWELTLGGRRPLLLSSGRIEPWSARLEFLNDRIDAADGSIQASAIWLRLDRTVAGGVHEDIDLVSHARRGVRFTLALALESDFADVFDVRAREPRTRGSVVTRWSDGTRMLRRTYANGPFRRTLELSVRRASSPPAFEDGRIAFDVRLAPGERWHTCLLWLPLLPGTARPAVLGCNAVGRAAPAGRRVRGSHPPHVARMVVRSSSPEVDRAWAAAIGDLETLRLEDGSGLAVPAAGIPWYATLFGRDALVTSGLALPAFPDYAAGSLERLAALQAIADDPVRDMEPGKIPHEIRHGELAELGLLPFHPYYGTHDATSLFVILVAEYAAWTGDAALVRRLLPHAASAMNWIDRFGDRDADGLQEYGPRAPGGFAHQGWKDSHDGIPTESGDAPVPPIALCELQGYAYAAKVRLADLVEEFGRPADARRLRAQAARLLDRVNEAFWWEAEGTYYLGLDGGKRPIRSVASNAGHLLGSGIVPPDRAGRVAARLLAPDMWSGWGVRTLSADHPAYDPFSYHRGSVWPHDNAMFAAGLRLAGLAGQAARVARAVLDAAASFEGSHLPELYAGVPRAETGVPVPYRDACIPQAWAAAAVISLVLGLAGVSATRNPRRGVRMYVRPALPDWLPELTIEGLRGGNGAAGLRIRDGAVEILSNTTGLEILSP